MKERRYNFRGHKIKSKKEEIKDIEDEEQEEEEKESISFSWVIPLILVTSIAFSVILIFPIISDFLDAPIDGEYTIQIYVPCCDDGELFYEEHNVSGQFLYDNDLGERKSMGDNELKPSDNFQKWDKYINDKTGGSIPGDNCCIKFVKE